jgi:hypothetical protein
MYLFIIAVTCHDAAKVITLRALGKLEKKRASGAPSTPASKGRSCSESDYFPMNTRVFLHQFLRG